MKLIISKEVRDKVRHTVDGVELVPVGYAQCLYDSWKSCEQSLKEKRNESGRKTVADEIQRVIDMKPGDLDNDEVLNDMLDMREPKIKEADKDAARLRELAKKHNIVSIGSGSSETSVREAIGLLETFGPHLEENRRLSDQMDIDKSSRSTLDESEVDALLRRIEENPTDVASKVETLFKNGAKKAKRHTECIKRAMGKEPELSEGQVKELLDKVENMPAETEEQEISRKIANIDEDYNRIAMIVGDTLSDNTSLISLPRHQKRALRCLLDQQKQLTKKRHELRIKLLDIEGDQLEEDLRNNHE
jgi:hypothetical protein